MTSPFGLHVEHPPAAARSTTAARRAGALLVGLLLLAGLYLTGLRSYLLFHTLIELVTVTVAAGVFAIAWNARRHLGNSYLLFVGIGSIFVALIDLFHTLAYEGMGVLEGQGTNLASQLWVAGRALQAFAFLAAPFLLGRRLRVDLVLAGFAGATTLLLASILYWGAFPTTYVPGEGLTMFKKGAEYIISATLLVAAGLLYRRREAFEPDVRAALIASLVLTVAAELAFTLYVSAYGAANMIGHILRLVASYLLYRAIIQTGLVKPHALLVRELNRTGERLREYAEALETTNEGLRLSELRLRQHAADLEVRNEELDAFAHTVAHDLKSPLSVILANAELLTTLDELPPERAGTLLERIAATAGDMSDIIDHLLLLAEVRKVDAPRHRLDMEAIIGRVCERLGEMVGQYGADVEVAEEWPAAVGYGPWVEEVWVNYVTNALKYGGRPPRVALGASVHHGAVRFWVRDNGPGIPSEACRHLFVPFHRLGAIGASGHGLGLSIVVQIVEKLGGEVGVESEPGHGSLFYFTLPAAATRQPEPVPV